VEWSSPHPRSRLYLGDWRIFEDVVALIRLCLDTFLDETISIMVYWPTHRASAELIVRGRSNMVQIGFPSSEYLQSSTYLGKWYVKYDLTQKSLRVPEFERNTTSELLPGHQHRILRTCLSVHAHSKVLLLPLHLLVLTDSSHRPFQDSLSLSWVIIDVLTCLCL